MARDGEYGESFAAGREAEIGERLRALRKELPVKEIRRYAGEIGRLKKALAGRGEERALAAFRKTLTGSGGLSGCTKAAEGLTELRRSWNALKSAVSLAAAEVGDALFELAEEGDKLFDDEIVTDYPRKLTIADTIREKYLARMRQEVPHELGVLVKSVKEGAKGWSVDAEVLVNRPSQRPIVIGRGAETIKHVRKCAERELSELFGVRVALELWVRVEPGWMTNKRLLAEMGYLGGLV